MRNGSPSPPIFRAPIGLLLKILIDLFPRCLPDYRFPARSTTARTSWWVAGTATGFLAEAIRMRSTVGEAMTTWTEARAATWYKAETMTISFAAVLMTTYFAAGMA